MADQANYSSTLAVADPELARRKTQPSATEASKSMTKNEQDEKEEINEIVEARKQYQKDRQSKEKEWTESFKMYMSWVDKVLNPFLSNLFIPKTHEAVELLAAFLIGTNQSISATPENGSSDTMKSRVAGKWLDFLWRKVLKARIKILVWIKQGIIFGNGVMKFGWDPVKKQAWMSVCAIEDVYFDYFVPDIQDSEYVIHEIRRDEDDVKSDTKYDLMDKENKLIRDQVICGGTQFDEPAKALFNTFDGSFSRAENKGKVLVMEVWCKGEDGNPQLIKTLLPTSLGWRVARRATNPNNWRTEKGEDGEQFRPFVKLRFKTSALPNRAYDMSAVYPTIHIQKAFNDFMRQYADGVAMVNNPMWKKRRGARINPQELVRRPGGIITMGDVNKDLITDVVGDMKQSIIEMLNRLDREFQEASMIVNLVKGISQSQTATGDAIAQQNVQTLLDMINDNIVDALSEAGQMVLSISLSNAEGQQSLVLYENEKEMATLDFDPKNIDGMHDIVIRPDRNVHGPLDVRQKQLLEFLTIIKGDPLMIFKYPGIMEKIYRRWLENAGFSDADSFFEPEPGGLPPGMFDKPKIRMDYKDMPEDVKREAEASAGYKPSAGGGVTAIDPNAEKSPVQPDTSGKIPMVQ